MTELAQKIETSLVAYFETYFHAVTVDGAGNPDANVEYEVGNWLNSKPVYLSGTVRLTGASPDFTGDGAAIYWASSQWNIAIVTSGSAAIVYNSNDAVATPDLVTTWAVGSPGNDPVPTSVTAGETPLINAGESDSEKSAQCILCLNLDGEEEDPAFSGNIWSPVRIELRTPAAANAQLDIHEAAAGTVEVLLTNPDLAAALSEATADFTCFAALQFRPLREQNDTYWMSGYEFRVYSCSRSF